MELLGGLVSIGVDHETVSQDGGQSPELCRLLLQTAKHRCGRCEEEELQPLARPLYLVNAASAFVKRDVEENLQDLHGYVALLPCEGGQLFRRDALKSSPRCFQRVRPAQTQDRIQLATLDRDRTRRPEPGEPVLTVEVKAVASLPPPRLLYGAYPAG